MKEEKHAVDYKTILRETNTGHVERAIRESENDFLCTYSGFMLRYVYRCSFRSDGKLRPQDSGEIRAEVTHVSLKNNFSYIHA